MKISVIGTLLFAISAASADEPSTRPAEVEKILVGMREARKDWPTMSVDYRITFGTFANMKSLESADLFKLELVRRDDDFKIDAEYALNPATGDESLAEWVDMGNGDLVEMSSFVAGEGRHLWKSPKHPERTACVISSSRPDALERRNGSFWRASRLLYENMIFGHDIEKVIADAGQVDVKEIDQWGAPSLRLMLKTKVQSKIESGQGSPEDDGKTVARDLLSRFWISPTNSYQPVRAESLYSATASLDQCEVSQVYQMSDFRLIDGKIRVPFAIRFCSTDGRGYEVSISGVRTGAEASPKSIVFDAGEKVTVIDEREKKPKP